MAVSSPATTLAQPVRGPSPLGQEVLQVLYQHRLMSTTQLHRLLTPHRSRPEQVRREVAQLRGLGLAASTVRRRRGGRELLSYLTPAGHEAVEAARELVPRAWRMSEAAAAGQLQEHTLAVNDTGLAFVDHARRLEHECGPLDWHAELAHRCRDGETHAADPAVLVPDAVLHYVRAERDRRTRTMLTFFLEVDRGTETVAQLAAKLAAYARYRNYIPAPVGGRRGRPVSRTAGREAWKELYPAFPRLLIVLTGRPASVLQRRAEDLRALVAADSRLRPAADGSRLRAGTTTLEELQQRGPFAPIVTPLLDATARRCNVLLADPDSTKGTA